MSDLNDKLLVKTFLLTRSEFVFRQLYRKHTLTLYRFVLSITERNIQDTEEIVQETWMRAINALPRFKWESGFRTWLMGIAVNCCREYKRKKQTMPERSIDSFKTGDAVIGVENKIDLHKAISVLPGGYREILLLHDLEGYKHHEISIILGISEGTSKSQLFHARKALKEILN